MALSKLPADVGDENGETIIDERKIRIKPLPKKNVPKPPEAPVDLPVSDVGMGRRSVNSKLLKRFLHILYFFLSSLVCSTMHKYLDAHYQSKHR